MRNHERVTIVQNELASSLRFWRERLTPSEAGLPAGGNRRVTGLRREEVAQLAGVSLDYLARLEQGRASNPSPSVLTALARALRLTEAERSHLYALAGELEPRPGTINRHITASLQRLLDRLSDVPVIVLDVTEEMIATNPLGAALFGDLSGASRRERNFVWRHFTGMPSRLVHTEAELPQVEAIMAATLRDALARFPDDQHLRSLVDDLKARSDRFAALWQQRPVVGTYSGRNLFRHPEIGEITLDCDSLTVRGTDLKLIVYTAPVGTADAQALALLGAVGLQSFAT